MAVPKAPLRAPGPEITRLGLGAWAIGGDWEFGWGEQDDAESVATIHRAVELGIDWIDTAAAYGVGHSEEVVGRALRELPESDCPRVFTKCGLVWREGERSVRRSWRPESLREECHASLRRLGVERLDMLQIHWPAADGSVEDAWGTLAELQDEGLVDLLGVSNFGPELLDRCESIRHVDSVQPPLSLITRHALADVIPWAAAHGTGVIVYSPMESGLLTGGARERLADLDESDHRRERSEFNEPRLSRNLALADALAEPAGRLDCSVAELAIAWTLSIPAVTATIVGARRPDQIDGWIRAASIDLDEPMFDEIAAIVERTGAGSGPTRPPAETSAVG